MSLLKYIIREWVELVGIATLLTLIWQGLELIFLRKIRPDIVDTIISIPIILLLHYEYKKYIRNYDINSN
jgi:hypothetical protein